MTAQEAKELSLEVWGHLKDHPEIDRKYNLPKQIYDKIATLICDCPLCEIYNNEFYECNGCPLFFKSACNAYSDWKYAPTIEDRKKYATEIYNKIKDWEIDAL